MKIRTDIVKMYRDVHGWVGIIAGLCLFIAFFAGALTMFEGPLQRWASPPPVLAPAPSLERTPELIAKVVAAHPEAAKSYQIHLEIDSAHPARMSWTKRGRRGDHNGKSFYASLAPDGTVQVVTQGPSPVAQFIDELHQRIGLPVPDAVAMPIMGGIALLYTIAIVSGLVVLLPSLVSDLFALRMGRNVKRMWLDMHNVLGLFSLPFHLVIALSCVVFAFHGEFYGIQGKVFGGGMKERPGASARAKGPPPPALPPALIVQRVKEQAPGFHPITLVYGGREGGPGLQVNGVDDRYAMRAPAYGIAGVDPRTGAITARDYMPGHQDGWAATTSTLFALHFGSFGGMPIRWAYFLMGLAGALLFYTGNLLWVESRRKKERKSGAVTQTRATRILGALTVGVPLGCVAGTAVTLAAAKLLGAGASLGLHSGIYYAVFTGMTGWALTRGAARAGAELAVLSALAMLGIPAASLVAGSAWYDGPDLLLVDGVAILLAGALLATARGARRRAVGGARDSVWALPSPSGQ